MPAKLKPSQSVSSCPSRECNLRIAIISPFIDRQHGTERAVAELLERLATQNHDEVHLYAQRVQDLAHADLQTVASIPPRRWPSSESLHSECSYMRSMLRNIHAEHQLLRRNYSDCRLIL
jgi:hypothetical protein